MKGFHHMLVWGPSSHCEPNVAKNFRLHMKLALIWIAVFHV